MLEHSAFTQNAPIERKRKGIGLLLKTTDMTEINNIRLLDQDDDSAFNEDE